MSVLIEESWILISAPVVSLLWHTDLVDVHEENPTLYRYIVGKRSIYLAFSDNCGYFFLMPHQKSTSSSYLVALWNTKSYQWTFLNRLFFFSILSLQKNWRESTESSHPPPLISPYLLASYIKVVHLLLSMSQYWYIINL